MHNNTGVTTNIKKMSRKNSRQEINKNNCLFDNLDNIRWLVNTTLIYSLIIDSVAWEIIVVLISNTFTFSQVLLRFYFYVKDRVHQSKKQISKYLFIFTPQLVG